jgi:hypothetical protein
MAARLTHAALLALALSACTPKAEELDGAPSEPEPGELAGGPPAQQVVLPGVINLTQPMGSQIVPGCERTIAPDYDHPPAMTCLLFLVDEPAGAKPAQEVDSSFLRSMKSAGWNFIRATGAERYFERPKDGADCADLAAVIVLDETQAAAIVTAAKANQAPLNSAWQAYAIPAQTRETCGADRMKPQQETAP